MDTKEHVINCFLIEMHVSNWETDDGDKQCNSRAPFPTVGDEGVLQLHSQENQLCQDVVEQYCNPRAQEPKNDNEDDLMV